MTNTGITSVRKALSFPIEIDQWLPRLRLAGRFPREDGYFAPGLMRIFPCTEPKTRKGCAPTEHPFVPGPMPFCCQLSRPVLRHTIRIGWGKPGLDHALFAGHVDDIARPQDLDEPGSIRALEFIHL